MYYKVIIYSTLYNGGIVDSYCNGSHENAVNSIIAEISERKQYDHFQQLEFFICECKSNQ